MPYGGEEEDQVEEGVIRSDEGGKASLQELTKLGGFDQGKVHNRVAEVHDLQ